jgi:hypothetical protein
LLFQESLPTIGIFTVGANTTLCIDFYAVDPIDDVGRRPVDADAVLASVCEETPLVRCERRLPQVLPIERR